MPPRIPVSVVERPLTPARLPIGRGAGVRGRQVNKLDRNLNFIATK